MSSTVKPLTHHPELCREIRPIAIRYTTRGGGEFIFSANGDFVGNAGKKSEITELSDKSRKKLAFVASNADCKWSSMITLTYGEDYPTNGKQVKVDFNRFLCLVRKKLPNVKYLWFLEFQQRGAPHCHILLSVCVQPDLYDALCTSWCNTAIAYVDNPLAVHNINWFNSAERGEFWQNSRKPNGLARYAVKYACKPEQKTVGADYVNVGRFWGASRDLVVYLPDVPLPDNCTIKDVFPDKPLYSIPKYVFGD